MSRMTLFNRLARYARMSTPRGREIVLNILKSTYPTPVHARDLYERVRKEYADEKLMEPLPAPPIPSCHVDPASTSGKKKVKPQLESPPPPYPEHPIRSLKYLKTIILEELAQRNQVAKVHSMREPTPEELEQKKTRAKGKKRKTEAPTVFINTKGMVDQWGWVLKTPKELESDKRERLRIKKAVEGQRTRDPKEIEEKKRKEFEEEWKHLNVRRRRARVGKLEREEEWASLLESGRQQGVAETHQKAQIQKWDDDVDDKALQ